MLYWGHWGGGGECMSWLALHLHFNVYDDDDNDHKDDNDRRHLAVVMLQFSISNFNHQWRTVIFKFLITIFLTFSLPKGSPLMSKIVWH